MSNQLNVLPPDQPWYAEGLRFECTGCGQCCTGAPGYIWVTDEEIAQIADQLQMNIDDFRRQYVRTVGNKQSLTEREASPGNYDCVFLKDKKCQIYSVRPKQCRTFPWWPQNLKSLEDWQHAARSCEGISCAAPVVTSDIIQDQLALQQGTLSAACSKDKS